MTRQELDELRDRLYVLSETVKEVERDLADDETDDGRRLLNVLLDAASQSVSESASAPAPTSTAVSARPQASVRNPTGAAPPNRR